MASRDRPVVRGVSLLLELTPVLVFTGSPLAHGKDLRGLLP